jgi:hypothetical protein
MGSLVASSTTVPRRVDCAALLTESISVNPKRAFRREVSVLIAGQRVKKKKARIPFDLEYLPLRCFIRFISNAK